jgi:NAD(P)-dependent dehydrogenase (short-subunit alcohol dehydrogenase family)
VTWAAQGIRVNGITPGGTATEMIDAWEAIVAVDGGAGA